MCDCITAASKNAGPVIDYEFAREELMMKEMGDNPVAGAVQALEKQHEHDKQGIFDVMNSYNHFKLSLI